MLNLETGYIDTTIFNKVLTVPALALPSQRIGDIQKNREVREILFRTQGLRNIIPDPSSQDCRLVLLSPAASTVDSLPTAAKNLVNEGVAKLTSHQVEITYDNISADEILRRVLPEGVEIPRGFETIGHVAHFNLRDQQLPYRKVIGKVILDKNPCLRTVVTKIGSLSNEFRTFDMEVIAGCNDTQVVVRERKLKLEFDFRKVYWNSRLCEERVRLLEQVQPDDIVCDLFGGVGAFALMSAEKGCRVYANDLNPAGAEAMRRNASLNRLDMTIFNMDARECVKALGKVNLEDMPATVRRRVHIIMNLPELALDFLDAFREQIETGKSALFCGTSLQLIVHCHCFVREKGNPDSEVHPRLIAAMGQVPAGTKAREVRDVAPKKNMFCVEFSVPLLPGSDVSDASLQGSSGDCANDSSAEPKRQRII